MLNNNIKIIINIAIHSKNIKIKKTLAFCKCFFVLGCFFDKDFNHKNNKK